ncbi:hypothetical protein FRC04_006080 [Tulasnella sp. 424]|nr:hypothetical protein FRC04_006080 [Tulasnella sp. 424]KAG8961369.1 hypothetical protein FRC05_006237 [Tulasnella sp. 425]
MTKYYAVREGRVPGVYRSWEEAQAQTDHFPGAKHKSFTTLRTAIDWSLVPLAQQPPWVRSALGVSDPVPASSPPPGPPPPYTPQATGEHSLVSAVSASQVVTNPTRPVPTSGQMSGTDLRATGGRNSFGHVNSRHTHARRDLLAPEDSSAADAQALVLNTIPQCIPTVASPVPQRVTQDRDIHTPLRFPPLTQGSAVRTTSRAGVSDRDEPETGGTRPVAFTGSPLRSNPTSPITNALRPDYVQWSPTNHSGWVEDSLLSGIFHPSQASTTSEADISHQTDNSIEEDDGSIDPFKPLPEGLFGAPDEHPGLHRIHLSTSPRQSTEYSPFLALMLGEHAVNYMFTHYFTAGSTVVVANAYARFAHSANGFVRHLVAMGLAPRHAAYLWTIISPEVMIPRRQRTSSTAGRAQTTNDHFASDNDTSDDGGDERVGDRVSPSSVVEPSAERGVEQSITQSTRVTEEQTTTSDARVGSENDLMEVDSDIEYIDVPYADPGEGDENRAE